MKNYDYFEWPQRTNQRHDLVRLVSAHRTTTDWRHDHDASCATHWGMNVRVSAQSAVRTEPVRGGASLGASTAAIPLTTKSDFHRSILIINWKIATTGTKDQ